MFFFSFQFSYIPFSLLNRLCSSPVGSAALEFRCISYR